MKKLFMISMSCLLLLACTELELSPSKNPDVALTTGNQSSQLDIGPIGQYVWTKLSVPATNSYPFNSANGDNRIISLNNDVYCMVGGAYEVVYKLNNATKRWEVFQDTNEVFSPLYVYQYFFSYQTKYYYGLMLYPGNEGYFASRDIVTGELDELAPFPGTPVSSASFFVCGNKGYLIGGYSSTSNNVVNQFWEYDFALDQWNNKGALPGGGRASASTFVLNNKVYYGLGIDIINLNGTTTRRFKNDWYQMNPATGGYAAVKADFPGTKRSTAKSFTINNKLYLGWGWTGQPGDVSYLNDFWEYNPETNTWTQKTNCPASSNSQDNTNVFAIGNAGYLVKGWMNNFWRYSNSSIVPLP